MGVGYIKEEGLIKHETLEKLLFSMSDELRLSKAVKVGFNFNGYRGKLPQMRDFTGAIIATPIVEPFNFTHKFIINFLKRSVVRRSVTH